MMNGTKGTTGFDGARGERRVRWLGTLVVLALLAGLAVTAWRMPAPAPQRLAAQPPATLPAPHAVDRQRRAAAQIQFEPNRGQAAGDVRYLSRGPAHGLMVFDDGMLLSAPAAGGPASARLRFVGAAAHAALEARMPSGAHTNYLAGGDPAAWVRGVPRYAQLRQNELYPGIDLVYYGRDGQLEFDLVVKPGADPAPIRLRVAAQRRPVITADGELLLDGPDGRLRLHRPVAYQNIAGQRRQVDGRYVMLAADDVGFSLAAYDKGHPLVIDPVFKLLYSTYLGGVHDDQVGGMALDAQGNAYVIGNSGSEDWPVSGNAWQSTRKAIGSYVRNLVVTKFDASGTLVYSTFLGGSTNDYGTAIAVDAAGNAYLTGNTTSSDFPVTAGAYQTAFKGASSAYLAILSPDGSNLRYATFYGGSGGSQGQSVALDASGAIVLAGSAGPGLPTTAGAYKTTLATGSGAFVARFGALAGGAPQLAAASYYGVDNPQANGTTQGASVLGMALDASGAPWFTGQAFTTNLPLSAGALQSAPPAMSSSCAPGPGPLNSFAYVAGLSADLKTLAYASYLSGRTEPSSGTSCSEFGRAITLDALGNVYVSGGTASAAFPTTAGALQTTLPIGSGFGNYSSFVTKLNPTGTAILWSTYFGGNAGSTFPGGALVADSSTGALWMAVVTGGGGNYPLSADALQAIHGGGGSDAGIAAFDTASGALKYSSYLGGSGADVGLALALDAGGSAYVAGTTTSTNFPVTAGAFQPALTANAYDGSDWFFSVLGAGTIGRLSTTHAGNSGDATVTLNGAGFQAGATCSLVPAAGTTLTGGALVNADGTQADCVFALSGAAPGIYDLQIANPDGSSLRRPAAFTVEAGGRPDFSVQFIGRPKIRTGVASKFTVTVTNTGNMDAYAVPLWIEVPTRMTASFDAAVPAFADLYGPNDGTTRRISLLIPRLLAGAAYTVPMELTATSDAASLPLNAFVQAPWFRTLAAASAAPPAAVVPECVPDAQNPAFSDCSGLYYDYALDAVAPVAAAAQAQPVAGGPGARALGGRARPLADPCSNMVSSYKQGQDDGIADGKAGHQHKKPGDDRLYNIGYDFGFVIGGLEAITDYLNSLHGGSGASGSASPLRAAAGGRARALADQFCPARPKPQPPQNIPSGGSGGGSGSGGAIDPNDKVGPAGDGSAQHFVRAGVPFTYEIAFENQPSATLSAARVVVTDTLDPAKVDLASVTLGSISFGSQTIVVPPGLRSYATTHAIDATMSVRVQGSLDSSTGVLKWTFDTIDPVTRLAPSDPTLGFLPPDTDGRKGQGYVTFTVVPKAGLPNGTAISNQASIVFDANAAIATPVWTNTFDLTAPTSRVQSLTPQAGTTTFDVAWSGSDSASGVRNYTVYVSDNGAAFAPWLTQVGATTAAYDGTAGHSYAFYVVATDGAGNNEPAKSAAEATINVTGNFADPSSGGGGGCTIGGAGRDGSLPLLALAAAVLLWRRRRSAQR